MNNKTPGEIVKEARLNKKLSVSDVSKATNITSRYIQALEENNFSFFPAPIYLQGFLKTYGIYLKLDINLLMKSYKKLVIAEEHTPLKELTNPIITWKNILFIILKWFSIISLFCISTYLSILTVNHIFYDQDKKDNLLYQIEKKSKSQNNPLQNVATKTIQLRDGFSIEIFHLESGVNFIPDIDKPQNKLHLILKKITFSTENPESFKQATLFTYPLKDEITLFEDKIAIIKNKILPHVIYIKLLGYTPKSIKVRISQGRPNPQYETKKLLSLKKKDITQKLTLEQDTSTKNTNPNRFIDLKLQVLAPNFLEIYVDGQLRKKEIVPPNTYLTYRSEQTIQIKIGDAGTIKITINGKQYTWGKQGQQVNKVIQKLKDPLTKDKFSIQIKDL